MKRSISLGSLGSLGALGLFGAGFVTFCPAVASAEDFTYDPPGVLVPSSGEGRVDDFVYAPGMRFPMEEGPAFANSQVYGVGGSEGPAGSQCDAPNFSYPWHDNYCEIRQWDMPLCPAGTGHQGQDIRAATCDADVHWAVAAADGAITSIGNYSVYLTAPDGTRYDYLHMSNVQVNVGDDVTRGQRLGLVSNQFNGTPTTVHLHFNLQQYVEGVGTVYVPPYMSLVTSYQALVGPPPGTAEGALEGADCDGVRGYAWEPTSADTALTVRLSFDGASGDPSASELDVLASESRDDLCDSLGSCAHAFTSRLPLSLGDGAPHDVYALGLDATGGGKSVLEGSPRVLSCDYPLPSGGRRAVLGFGAFSAWGFSAFWDVLPVDDGVLAGLGEGPALDAEPHWVKDAGGGHWLIDGGLRRSLPVGAEEAWHLGDVPVEDASADDLAQWEKGAPLGERPVLVQGSGSEVFFVDAAAPAGEGGGGPITPWLNGSAEAEADASCDCGVAGGPRSLAGLGAMALGLVAAGLRTRRRRVAQSSQRA